MALLDRQPITTQAATAPRPGATDSAMVEAINGIGHVMGKRKVAESVEDPSTMERLRELGVDYAQGFAIARPTPFLAVGAGFAVSP